MDKLIPGLSVGHCHRRIQISEVGSSGTARSRRASRDTGWAEAGGSRVPASSAATSAIVCSPPDTRSSRTTTSRRDSVASSSGPPRSPRIDTKRKWAQRRIEQLLPDLRGRTVAVWGLTYKPGTDTLRRSASIELCQWLNERGVTVRAHDPAVRSLPASLAAQIELADNAPGRARCRHPGLIAYLAMWLISAAARGLAKSVIFTGYVPRSEITGFIAAADVGVSPIRPIPLYWISSPTKFVQMLGMACPVVANDIPEQRKILMDSRAGLVAPYEVGPFAHAILKVLR